ncbi:hypothetical protein Taro_046933 [Colocasia esculenta]|uniref:Uncharacterized protein n=1 Tax=Colocasia esculenta TaxID=4460 RepID=A0A843X355_COLES|nr:hypothetical protein [Colocasia esculenta]
MGWFYSSRVVFGRGVPEPPSAENTTSIEVAMLSRPARPPRHHHDALACHDIVATALGVATARCIVTTAEIGETSQQWQGARRVESPDPWAATTKIGSLAWAEGRVLGVVTVGIRARSLTGLVVDLNCNEKRRQARELMEQQGESDMPAPGQVQEDVSTEESVAQPQEAAAIAVAGPSTREHGSLGRRKWEVSLQYLPQQY